ncbi:MAG: response regulator [Magnetococcales bacterium]|nr:response regulator [Magnetococcales bacterium]
MVEGQGSSVLIVLIEDEPQIRRFVRSALELEPYQVIEAEAGKRGLIEVGTRRPDLVVLDLGFSQSRAWGIDCLCHKR